MTHSKAICENDLTLEGVETDLCEKFLTLDPESYPGSCISAAVSSPFSGNTRGVFTVGFHCLLMLF